MVESLPPLKSGHIALIAAIAAMVVISLGRLTLITMGSIVLQPFIALLVLGGILIGPVAIVGALVGYLISIMFHGAGSVIAIWEGIGYGIIGIMSYTLWGGFGLVCGETKTDSGIGALLGEFVAVAAGATIATTVIITVGYEFLGYFRLYPPGVFTGVNYFLSIVLFGSPFLVISALLSKDMFALRRSMQMKLFQTRQTAIIGFLLFPLIWLFVGSVISIGYQVAELIPEVYYVRFGLGWLLPFRDPVYVGKGGAAVQLGVGVFFLVLWSSYLRRQATS